MIETREDFAASDGKKICVRRFEAQGKAKAALLVVHGMVEHSARYARLAAALSPQGLEVFVPDLRGHGLTATGPDELGHLADSGGFFRVMDDLAELTARIKDRLPGLPLYIMGHSMGSFLVQGLMARSGMEYSGAILSGTAGPGNPLVGIGVGIGNLVCSLKGPRSRSPFLDAMALGSYKKAFKPTRTAFDWLSRDEAEVDAYARDPLCGFVCTAAFYRDLAQGLSYIHKRGFMDGIPRSLPVYLFAGALDPVGAAPGTLAKLVERYRAMGMKDVELKVYPGGRHESLNETNRDEVTRDLRAWLESRMGRR